MKALTFLVSVVFAFAELASARPLTVGAPDGSGNVSITIGGTGAQNQTLIAAWANGDKGNDPLDWTEYADAGTVAPSDTSKTFQIPAAWRAKSGAVRFFLMSGEKPYGKRFDYITRPNCDDGGLYIDTLIKPDSTLDITVRLRSDYMSTGSAMAPFGISGLVYIFPFKDYDNAYYYDFFGAKNTTSGDTGSGYGTGILRAKHENVFGERPPRDSEIHEFRLNRKGLYIDGYRHLNFIQSEITGSNTGNKSIWLFDRNGSARAAGTTCSIYGATIVTNGVLAAELVPVAAPSGYVEMWDRVTRSWRGRSGSQSGLLVFIAGNDIGPYPPDCGSVECVSSVLNFGPLISVSSPDFSANTIDVALSAGHGTGLLLAVADADDEGEVFSNWATNTLVQDVSAEVDEVTFALPREWVRNNYKVRFAWKTTDDLPYDGYEVANLRSDGTGTAHFRSGIVPTTNTTISVMAKVANDVCPFGLTSHFYLFQNSKTVWAGFFGKSGSAAISDNNFVNTVHEWTLGPAGASIDGVDMGIDLSGFSEQPKVNTQIPIPFRMNYENGGAVGKTGNITIFGAKIWKADEIVRDFIPCVTNGVPVFYDRVRGEYYGSRTAAPFVAGAPVVADGDILSWSEVRSLRKGFAIIFR